ncbi:MAG: metallophosphoesterase family protein [Candidatus Hodarchaeales archaeon]|jgi:exonuclease SbcD
MTKILIVADVHIGKRYAYRVDLKTGISHRTLDFINAFARVVNYAIKNQVDIFVIAGDLYDRITIGPTLLRYVREKVWKPLIKAEIPIVCIGGNHDSPQIFQKGSPLGEISLIPNSKVTRIPETVKIKSLHTNEEIGFVLLPYMTAAQITNFVEKQLNKKIEKERQLNASQEFMKEFLANEINELETKKKIVVGHFFFQDSKINVIPYPNQLPHEFFFKKDMLSIDDIDLAVFGHVHTKQVLLDGKVVVPGSLERVDFGEIKEEKGFYIYDTDSKNLEFISNNPRELIRHYIEIPLVDDPTGYLIDKIPAKIEDAIVRFIIKSTPEIRKLIERDRRIREKLKVAFHYDIIWDTTSEKREIILPEFVLDPLVLFNDFISEKFDKNPDLEILRETGLKILDRALSRVEEKQ